MFAWPQTIHRLRAGLTLSLLLVVAIGATRPAAADARPAARSEPVALAKPAALTRAVAPVRTSTTPVRTSTTPARTSTPPGSHSYRVVSGDTLFGIAQQLQVAGGWRAIYAPNRSVIGPDPDLLLPGVRLTVPAARADAPGGIVTPARHYVTARGDNLTRIAHRLGVTGGWPVLYTLNRSSIGPDPDRLRPGVRLTVPGTAAAGRARSQPASTTNPASTASPRPGATTRSGVPATTTPVATTPVATTPAATTTTPATAAAASVTHERSAGVPSWLQAMLLLVGLMVVLFLLGEPAVVAVGRGRPAAVRLLRALAGREGDAESERWPVGSASPAVPPPPAQPADPARQPSPSVLLVDHDRLVVTSVPGRGVIVLRPPGQAIEEILRVARVALTDGDYRVLGQQLGAGRVSDSRPRSLANGFARTKLRTARAHAFGAVDGPVR